MKLLFTSFFIAVIFCLNINNVFAQENDDEQTFALVKLKNDSIIYGKKIRYKERPLKYDLVYLDKRKFKSTELKLYQKESGELYAKIGRKFEAPIYSSEKRGLSFYKVTTTHGGGNYSGSGGSYGGGGSSTSYYYSKDLSDAKFLKLNNIRKDFTGSKKTTALINKAVRRRTIAKRLFLASAGVTFLSSFTPLLINTESSKLGIVVAGIGPTLGLAGLVGGIVFIFKKKYAYRQAVKTYSGFDIREDEKSGAIWNWGKNKKKVDKSSD